MGVLNTSVPAQTELDFKALAERKGKSVSSIIRGLVEEFMAAEQAAEQTAKESE